MSAIVILKSAPLSLSLSLSLSLPIPTTLVLHPFEVTTLVLPAWIFGLECVLVRRSIFPILMENVCSRLNVRLSLSSVVLFFSKVFLVLLINALEDEAMSFAMLFELFHGLN